MCLSHSVLYIILQLLLLVAIARSIQCDVSHWLPYHPYYFSPTNCEPLAWDRLYWIRFSFSVSQLNQLASMFAPVGCHHDEARCSSFLQERIRADCVNACV